MTGNPPDLPAFAALAREHDALLYVDDAHGFRGHRGAHRLRPQPAWAQGQRRGPLVRRVLRPRGAGRRLLQGLLVAAGLPGLPDHAQAVPQGDGALVPVRGPGAGGLAGHGPAGACRSTGAAGTTYEPSSTTGPGCCSTTWTSSGWPPAMSPASPWSSWPWLTPPTWTRSAGTCSTGAST
jgi:hypothetical protein